MQRLLLLILMNIGGSSIAMHLQKGQITTWHTREYRIIETIEKADSIDVVMSRPIHQVCGMPLATEYVTRNFKRDAEKVMEVSASSTHQLSSQGKQVLAATGSLTLFLIAYLLY